MARIDLRRAFKQLFRAISQMNLLATKIDEYVFVDATMSIGLRNTCKLFEEDFMTAFVKGLHHHHPALFADDSMISGFWPRPRKRIDCSSLSLNTGPLGLA